MREIGNTGIMVSAIGMGTNTISGQGTYGVNDEADGAAAVERAYELGVTFFDTAEGYSSGRSEEVLGRVLGNKPDVVICTKVGGRAGAITPDRIRIAAESSLRRLRRETIDIYLLHNPETSELTDPAIKDALEGLKTDGIVRSYGVSCQSRNGVEQALVSIEHGYTSLQMNLNITAQEIVDTVRPLAQERGVGILARVPLASGLLTGKYDASTVFSAEDGRSPTGVVPNTLIERALAMVPELVELAKAEGVPLSQAAIAWVLTHRGVSSVIPGAKNVTQVESNVAAGAVTLSEAFVDRARALGSTPAAAGD